MDYIICHYHEIGLKGKNRKFFEEKLVENIKKSLSPSHFEFVKRISGRIIVKLASLPLRSKDEGRIQKEIENSLKRVFGIAYFAFAGNCSQKIETIQKKALEVLKEESFKTFRVTCRRAKKEFPLTSQEICEKVGEWILGKFKIKVDLENPEKTLFIEIVEKYAFLYTEKIRGAGGLPVGVSSKAVALVSSGIDSPVAAFRIMKRGAKVVFLHLHSFPYTDKASIEKTEKLIQLLSLYQRNSRLYLIPFADIQKEILLKTPAKLRVILYRRFMFRIAREIAKLEKAKAIVTGESLGQVASQTMENMKVIEEASDLPIFRPLIGEDKEEIIAMAKEIGTFDISILPHQDCCSRFLPEHPETRARLEEVTAAEKKLKVDKLVRETLKNAQLKIVN